MKVKSIRLIVLFASLSLCGIIITQLFWMGNGYRLKEEQFNSRVEVALKSVVNQLMLNRNDSLMARMSQQGNTCFNEPITLVDILDFSLLDTLIRKEFSWMSAGDDYIYGVFEPSTGIFLYSSDKMHKESLLVSAHAVSLECLCRADPYVLGVHFINERSIILGQIILWLLLSIIFLLVMAAAFSVSIVSIFRQKRISQMKTDFVNNMTHEFKTPISTISLASEMLLKPQVNESPNKTKRYASIIFDENTRLKHQVEQVLQVAILDRGDFRLKFREVNVHRLLEDVVRNFILIIKERHGRITTRFNASSPVMQLDKVHFTNVIHNLLDNAAKYSPESPQIQIATNNLDGGIVISVEDHGIGISHENLKNIFRRFYRVSTGNIHDIKGFGLGLFYVKTMVEAHGGTVTVKSELNKGSRFDLYFPYQHANLNKSEDEDEETVIPDIAG